MDRPAAVIRALLDTCVLVPALQRDFLLQLSAEYAYAPCWGTGILDELDYVLRGIGGQADHDDERRARLFREMGRAFPGASVHAPRGVRYPYPLADPDDGHVVHAALMGRADVLVSDDKKAGFSACVPLVEAGIEVRSAAEFATDIAAVHPVETARALTMLSARRRRPQLSPREWLDLLVARQPGMSALYDALEL